MFCEKQMLAIRKMAMVSLYFIFDELFSGKNKEKHDSCCVKRKFGRKFELQMDKKY